MSNEKKSRFAATDPGSSEWRRSQMIENNAIEGIERDPALAGLVDAMRSQDLTPEQQIARLIRMHEAPDAAE